MKHQIKEKKERALGTKLFLKAERCNSQKCVMIRRPYRPGDHGQKRRNISDYGKQLQEKQKMQIIYGLSNRQLYNFFKTIEDKDKILETLEHRLDRVVFLLGFAESARIARQLVSHGHILVGGRKVTVSSFHVKVGMVVSVRPESRKKKVFEGLADRLKKHTPPEWLSLKPEEFSGTCEKQYPGGEHLPFDINLVGEFYAR